MKMYMNPELVHGYINVIAKQKSIDALTGRSCADLMVCAFCSELQLRHWFSTMPKDVMTYTVFISVGYVPLCAANEPHLHQPSVEKPAE